jgi:hypothetical protein
MSRVRVGRAPFTTADDILNKAKRQKTSLRPISRGFDVEHSNHGTVATRTARVRSVLGRGQRLGSRGCRLFPSIELTVQILGNLALNDSCRYPLNAHEPPRTVEARGSNRVAATPRSTATRSRRRLTRCASPTQRHLEIAHTVDGRPGSAIGD